MDQDLAEFVAENSWKNELVLGAILPEKVWSPLPHFCKSWLRSFIGGTVIYLLAGSLCCLYMYYHKRCKGTSKDVFPTKEAMLSHIKVSMKALPWYGALPTVGEYMIERGWSKCFSSISDVGWTAYPFYVLTYLFLVEFGIYWIHRELHDIKPLYKLLHAAHHEYNNKYRISPFAGFAFHPLDGILQGLPHVLALFLVPMHFNTHTALLFFETVWTVNIHDCIHGDVWPMMGAGYHTFHHTTYRDNYGHYTVCMDWLFGTLRTPGTSVKQKSVNGK